MTTTRSRSHIARRVYVLSDTSPAVDTLPEEEAEVAEEVPTKPTEPVFQPFFTLYRILGREIRPLDQQPSNTERNHHHG
jgi:hypothetical protein